MEAFALAVGGSGYVQIEGKQAVKYFRSSDGTIRFGDIDTWMSEVLVRKVLGSDIDLCPMLSYDPKAFTLSMPLYECDLTSFLSEHSRYAHCPGSSRRERVQSFLLECVVPQVCYQLQAMHQRGIVHQDLKPENLLLRYNINKPHNWEVSLSDFGAAMIAKGRIYTALTTEGYFPDLEDYPLIDYRYDIYGLGKTLENAACRSWVYEEHYTPRFADVIRALTADYSAIPSPLSFCINRPPIPRRKRNRKRLGYWLKHLYSSKYTEEVCQAIEDLLIKESLKPFLARDLKVTDARVLEFVSLFVQMIEDEEVLQLIRSSLSCCYRQRE